MRLVTIAVAIFILLIGAAAAQTGKPDPKSLCKPIGAVQTSIPAPSEANCLAQLKGVAVRDGDNLHLKLDNGQTKTITSDSKACEGHDVGKCLVHQLVGYLPAQRLFILQVGAHESGAVMLVSRRTGQITQMDDWPHLSPSGKRFVVVAASEAYEIERDIAIFSTASDPPKLEFSYVHPRDNYALYSFLGWDGDDRVKLSIYMRLNEVSEPEDYDADVVRTAKGWQLNRP